jgi:hypothetical protein
LNSNASPEDALPLDGDRPFGEGMGLIYGSSRLLGESKAAKFWAISDENSDVCLAVLLKQTPGMAFSCVTADNFSTSGVKALLMAGGEYVEAYLVPDSLSLAKSVTGLEQVAPNLVAGDSRGQRAAIVFDTAKAITGGTVELEMSLLHPDDAG